MKLLIAEDHEMVRQGLVTFLKTIPNVEVVGAVPDGREAVKLSSELSPDVVLMDISMPGLNGVDAARLIHSSNPATKIIALSGNANDQAVRSMIEAGAAGFVTKQAAFSELEQAITAVGSGQTYISPSLSSSMNGWRVGAQAPVISQRERETLQLVAEGKCTKEIARILHISVKTVETHRRNLLEKLNVDSVAGLTKYAIREGLTSVN